MNANASQIIDISTVRSWAYSGWQQWNHRSSLSLTLCEGIDWWPVDTPQKGKWCGKRLHVIKSSWSTDWTTHYDDVMMSVMASPITSLAIVYSTVYSGADQRKHQRSASLAFAWGIRRWPGNSPHKWSVTRKLFLFDDVVMNHSQKIEIISFDMTADPKLIFVPGWCSFYGGCNDT